MREGLRAVKVAGELAIDEIDVDTDAALESRWGDLVPVLLAGDRELCHYRLDHAALARHLTREAANEGSS